MSINIDTEDRRKRWNRRDTDSAAWKSSLDTSSDERQPSSSSFSTLVITPVQSLFNYEPIHMTSEFKSRIASASRASIVSFAVIFSLTFPDQNALRVPWIGNLLALATLKSTLGHTILATKSVFVPMVPISVISFGISALLDMLHTTTFSILLPFVVMVGALIIMICPWRFLTSKNLMLVIFYLIVASPLAARSNGPNELADDSTAIKGFDAKFAPGLIGSCTVGLFCSLLVHLVLVFTPKSTTASRLVPAQMMQLSHQNSQLLNSISAYMKSIGKATPVALQARPVIEFYINARASTLAKLNDYLQALRAEKNLFCCTKRHALFFERAKAFVEYGNMQQKHAELVLLATTQPFLGEKFTSQDESTKTIKAALSDHLGIAVEELSNEYSLNEDVFFLGNELNEGRDLLTLTRCMENYMMAMRGAIAHTEKVLLSTDNSSFEPASGPLIRSRVVFHAVYNFVLELKETIERRKEIDTKTTSSKPAAMDFLRAPWPWNDLLKRRVAIRTSLALGLGTLFVSIPYLRDDFAWPNSLWVGISIASVSLEKTGSAYVKCIDRLWGTLIASAFGLLTERLFEQYEIAKIFSSTVFTFFSFLVMDPKRPYASLYAAVSISSILYGSFDKNMTVTHYVPGRIMLIFLGVAIFLLVELMIFPRSSRTVVQGKTIQFFEDMENFLLDLTKVCTRIPLLHGQNDENEVECDFCDNAFVDPLWMLRQGHKQMSSFTSDLRSAAKTVSTTIASAKAELSPGIAEPSVGLNVKLDVIGYENLILEQGKCHSQLDLLITTVESLAGYYECLPKSHPVRDLHWPSLLSSIIAKLALQLKECVDKLQVVFPYGLCRPGACEIHQIIGAVSEYRKFEGVRLCIFDEINSRHESYFNMIASSGEQVRYAPGFRLTLALATSAILTIGQSLQVCGKYLEHIVKSFPVEDVNAQKDSSKWKSMAKVTGNSNA